MFLTFLTKRHHLYPSTMLIGWSWRQSGSSAPVTALLNTVCQISCFIQLKHVSFLLSFRLSLIFYSTVPVFGMCDHVAVCHVTAVIAGTAHPLVTFSVLSGIWWYDIGRGYFSPSRLRLNYMIIVLCTIYNSFCCYRYWSKLLYVLCGCEALASLRHACFGSFFLNPGDVMNLVTGPSGTFAKKHGSCNPLSEYRAQRACFQA